MNRSKLQPFLDPSREALQSFAATLFSGDVSFSFGVPEEGSPDEARLREHVAVLSPSGGFALFLEGGWIPLLAAALPGQPADAGAGAAGAVLSDIVAQGQQAVRRGLARAGIHVPETTLEVLEDGLPLPALPAQAWHVAFTLEAGAQRLHGMAVLPEDVEAALLAVGGRIAGPAGGADPKQGPAVAPAVFPDLGREMFGGDGAHEKFELLAEVELEVTVELGRRRLPLADVLRLTAGSVVELEKLVGEPLEVYANGRLIAEGEAVVVDDQFGIRITRLASVRQRTRALS